MPKRLRIAIWYNLPSGGAKRSLYYQIEGLLKRGHQIELWRPPVPQESYLRLADLAPEHEIPLEPWERDSPFYFRKLSLYRHRTERMVAAFDEHARKCGEQINPSGFDLLFSNSCMHFHAPFIGRHVTLPKAIYLHEPRRHLYEASPTLPWVIPDRPDLTGWSLTAIKRRGRASIDLLSARTFLTEELKNIRQFDRIFVNSYFSRESVLRAYGLDAEVCYLGIDTRVFYNRGEDRDRYVICVGTLTASKNTRLVIESIARVPTNLRPKLVWVANMQDPPYLDEMRCLAQEKGVEFDLRLLVPDDELVDLLNRAWVMIYAPRLEPFGFAPLEACACGTPVIAVAEGGVRETIENGVNGWVVPHDPDEIASCLSQVLENPRLRDNLGIQAEETVKAKWTLDAANDRLERKLLKTLSAA